MAGTQESGRESTGLGQQDDLLSTRDVASWFVREVLPLEPVLTQYLQRNWHNPSDIVDLRQEVYARVCTSAQREIPREPQRFLLVTARNLLINRLRDARVIPIEATGDLDALNVPTDVPGPDRIAIARDELRRMQVALDQLPARCREAMVLAHIHGLSGHEIAQRMNITSRMVSAHLNNGLRLLANILHAEESIEGKAKP
jgi:RNA polymerase sigma-70 factor (ECF subfamily)